MSTSDLARRTRAQQGQNQDVAKRSQELAGKIAGQRSGFSAALADRIGVERFIRAAATVVRTTPKLADCSDDSILGALYIAAQLGLEVGGPRGLVYLVPYGKEATLIVGYRGWVDLIYRAGARSVQWFLIREGDHFVKGSDSERGPWYQWVPLDDDTRRPVVGAVAQVQTGSGGMVWDHLTRAEIDQRSTGSSIWRQWYDEMALKTVLRHLVKRLPTSTELALASSADETVQRRVETPGLPPEQRTEHLPLQPAPAPPQRPTAPPPPRPRAAVEEPPEPDYPDEAAPDPEDEDEAAYEARMSAEHDAYVAAQQDGAE